MRAGVALLGLGFGFVSALNWATLYPNPEYDATVEKAVLSLIVAVGLSLFAAAQQKRNY